jgi:hypothetical protein
MIEDMPAARNKLTRSGSQSTSDHYLGWAVVGCINRHSLVRPNSNMTIGDHNVSLFARTDYRASISVIEADDPAAVSVLGGANHRPYATALGRDAAHRTL